MAAPILALRGVNKSFGPIDVLHDITLDGNTFKSSHSVDKRPFVADVGYGIAMTQGNWRIAIARRAW